MPSLDDRSGRVVRSRMDLLLWSSRRCTNGNRPFVGIGALFLAVKDKVGSEDPGMVIEAPFTCAGSIVVNVLWCCLVGGCAIAKRGTCIHRAEPGFGT